MPAMKGHAVASVDKAARSDRTEGNASECARKRQQQMAGGAEIG